MESVSTSFIDGISPLTILQKMQEASVLSGVVAILVKRGRVRANRMGRDLQDGKERNQRSMSSDSSEGAQAIQAIQPASEMNRVGSYRVEREQH